MKNLQIVMASIVAVAVFSMAVAPIAPTAFAEGANGDAWGDATSSAATSDGQAFGDHAADPLPDVEGNETPRAGIGNISGDGTDKDFCLLVDALGSPSDLCSEIVE